MSAEPLERRWTVAADIDAQRLDIYLAATLDLPRSRIRGWIDRDLVTLDGRAAKPSTKVVGGEVVCLNQPPEPTDDRIVPEDIAIGEVLFVDQHLIVIDKLAGLVVHPGAGRRCGTLVNGLLARYPEIEGIGGAGRPGIVHRLDRDTSGVMVIARSDRAYRALSAAFAERTVDKRYLAILWGELTADFERHDPIGRHPNERQRMAVRTNGRPAISHFSPLDRRSNVTACEVTIETGRTHQIRVHAKAAGHPLVGDPLYGEARHKGLLRSPRQQLLANFARPALHAWTLAFAHPLTADPLRFTAPIPADLAELWQGLGGGELRVL